MISALLADASTDTRGPEFGEASPWGLVIVLLLLIGTILLIRSMNGHLRNLPESFDEPTDATMPGDASERIELTESTESAAKGDGDAER